MISKLTLILSESSGHTSCTEHVAVALNQEKVPFSLVLYRQQNFVLTPSVEEPFSYEI